MGVRLLAAKPGHVTSVAWLRGAQPHPPFLRGGCGHFRNLLNRGGELRPRPAPLAQAFKVPPSVRQSSHEAPGHGGVKTYRILGPRGSSECSLTAREQHLVGSLPATCNSTFTKKGGIYKRPKFSFAISCRLLKKPLKISFRDQFRMYHLFIKKWEAYLSFIVVH